MIGTRKKSPYNPVVRRRYVLKKLYGLTIEEYDVMLKKQDNICAICKTDTPGGMGRFYVDHNHVTNKVRGLLCHNCNFVIGHAKENADILYNASTYLLSTNEVNLLQH